MFLSLDREIIHHEFKNELEQERKQRKGIYWRNANEKKKQDKRGEKITTWQQAYV